MKQAQYTLILSDIHLADEEPPSPRSPLWKKFKSREYYIDGAFKKVLDSMEVQAKGPIELILNGDIFDFDSVMSLPDEPIFHISWLERRRGLNPEEPKSRFKIETILQAHHLWADALRSFMSRGNSVVFVIGNHDIELHWPQVQEAILGRIASTPEERARVSFVEWFYISNGDTLVEHGNQYDPYSLCMNPINPLIRKHQKLFLRIPFGNLAGKYLVNGMGLMNPHSEASYIKANFGEYMTFFFSYVLRIQPFIFWTWLWGSFVTLWVTVTEGIHPAQKDPLAIVDRIEEIATKANATPRTVLALRELHAHPACYNPFELLRELWLDRAIMLLLVFGTSFEVFLFFNLFTRTSIKMLAIPLVILFPAFAFYARSIRSGVQKSQEVAFNQMPVAAKIAGVKRVIHGHTHIAKHCIYSGIEHLNTGTWSPAFLDVECTKPYGKKCYAWIHPKENGESRVSELFEWSEKGSNQIDLTEP